MKAISFRADYRFSILLVIAFLSGLSGLIYELVWSRYLHLIFGISVYAVATVLTCYMLGVSLGSWHLGRRIDRSNSPRRLLFRIQLAIAGYLLLSPLLYVAFSSIAYSIVRYVPTVHPSTTSFDFV